MKIFGHPVHSMLVHFPSALLPMELVLSWTGYLQNSNPFYFAAYCCLLGGVITGLPTMVTGLIDLLSISSEEKKAKANGFLHGFLNGTVILIYLVFAWKAWPNFPDQLSTTMALLLVKTFLIITLFVGNFLGGKMIYHYHTGIEKKSPQDGK
jgi:uncharacterized membrane protein